MSRTASNQSTPGARIMRADRFCANFPPMAVLVMFAALLTGPAIVTVDRAALGRALDAINGTHSPATREWFNSLVRYLSRVVTDEHWDYALECVNNLFPNAGVKRGG